MLLGSFLHTVVVLEMTWDKKLVLCIDEWFLNRCVVNCIRPSPT